MKTILLLVAATFLFAICPLGSDSQNEKATPTFKIVGKTKLTTLHGEKTVEYDPDSPNHLYITDFGKNGAIVSKRQFLFSGKKFDLAKQGEYIFKKELIKDGVQTKYHGNGTVEKDHIFKDGILQNEIIYYKDGKKHLLLSGDENILSGEYKIWHPNGQLIFSGNYKNNVKDGEIQLFDEYGNLIRKGIYLDGILISGEAVVQDIVFDNPEVPAHYKEGSSTFNDYLKLKSADLKDLKDLTEEKKIQLDLIIDQKGKIRKIENLSTRKAEETQWLTSVFSDFPEMIPATVEDVPVQSALRIKLSLTNNGIQTVPTVETKSSSKIFSSAEEMPQFPGGQMALKKYLSSEIKYPVVAYEEKIEGKVYLSFIVNEEGNITDVKIVRSIHPSLDKEAIRVIKRMPKWEPGRIEGKPVKVSFTVPINFALQ